ncbi:hemolysin [Paracoccus methylarcula]|uniref:Hemolysin n=2 Tax=Paracoccus methylarcula TaxID=72022 RepID=A0A3R7LGT0_9RHOB|nr:hemolysin [Paracoccus methylarcula]
MEDITSIEITSVVSEDTWRNPDNNDDFWPAVVCFSAGTLIETSRGSVAVENLNRGDMIRTRDNGFQPIRWIGSRKIGTAELERNPGLRPVRIAAGALGNGLPLRDLVVSRQHRVLVQSPELDMAEALVPAKDLLALPGVEILDHLEHGVEYFHVLCENHEVLLAEGMPAESMLTGTEALKALDDTAREEIAILMPELRNVDYVPTPARRLLNGKPARKIVQRHLESRDPLSARVL